jgi:hypothetical protein
MPTRLNGKTTLETGANSVFTGSASDIDAILSFFFLLTCWEETMLTCV